MGVEVKGEVWCQTAVDTDSLNADSLKATILVTIEEFEKDCERKLVVPDWSRIEIAIHHDKVLGGTSLVALRSPIL